MIDFDQKEPSMRYESLAMFAFDCKRNGGPNNIASAEDYDRLFVMDNTNEASNVMNKLVDALIKKMPSKRDVFTNIKQSIPEKIEQGKGLSLIDYLIKEITD